jgi:hypothetical protein
MAIAFMMGVIFGFALSTAILTQFNDWVFYKYYNKFKENKKDAENN